MIERLTEVIVRLREFHRKYRFETRGVLLSRTVNLRLDYYQRLLRIRSYMESRLAEHVSLSEALAYIIEIAEPVIREHEKGNKKEG